MEVGTSYWRSRENVTSDDSGPGLDLDQSPCPTVNSPCPTVKYGFSRNPERGKTEVTGPEKGTGDTGPGEEHDGTEDDVGGNGERHKRLDR